MNKIIVLRPEKCIGCRSCELVCSFTRAKEFNPQRSAVTVIQYEKAMICVPIMCTQCEEAYCEKVCPVDAISKDENGARIIDEKRCIVCKMCMFACPLGNIAFDGEKVFKCDLCKGTPNCALHCPSGAIEYKEALPSNMLKRKLVTDKFKEAFGEEE